MGVLNVTPDSFSDGGQLASTQAVVDRAGRMLAEGADVLDVGGESTRPGTSGGLPVEEELRRVLPAIEALRGVWPDVAISVDTYKAEVADAAIGAGADIVNDVWGMMHGLGADERARWRDGAGGLRPTAMGEVAARRKCPVILMHNRPDRNYGDFWADVLGDLRASVAVARAAGVAASQIWLDPGFGFAKNPAQNLEVLRELRRIVALCFPVLVGTSRKSTIGKVLGAGVDDRIEGSGATVVWAIQQGAAMVRVHDVREMARFARMADAIKAGLGFSEH
jgi:dihydropteroate synthase